MRESRIDEKHVAQDGFNNETRERKHKKRCKKTIAQLKEQVLCGIICSRLIFAHFLACEFNFQVLVFTDKYRCIY